LQVADAAHAEGSTLKSFWVFAINYLPKLLCLGSEV